MYYIHRQPSAVSRESSAGCERRQVMKRISVLVLIPLMLFGLERVNLIKDHSFEMDCEVWHTRLGGSWPQIAEVNRYDNHNSHTGFYSGSGDTRPEPDNPEPGHAQNAFITQGFINGKKLQDIDSIVFYYSINPFEDDFALTAMAPILLHIAASSEDYQKIGYVLRCPTFILGTVPHYIYLEKIPFIEDTQWHEISRFIIGDIQDLTNVSLDSPLDSLILWNEGASWGFPWRGQKIYWDDVRLMGYADYDVGVKAILDSVEYLGESPNANSPQSFSYYSSPFTPSAHIKNFGREPADFQVFAEILQGETQVYIDSLDWSLPSDTDDTVSFSTFTPPDTGTYTLCIYTFMEPDESDADDEKTKELHFTAITEPPVTHPQLLTLEVRPTTITPLQVTYSLPNGYTGILTLFDASGRRVDAKRVWGYGSVAFNSAIPSGIYIVRLDVSGAVLSRKVIVVQ